MQNASDFKNSRWTLEFQLSIAVRMCLQKNPESSSSLLLLLVNKNTQLPVLFVQQVLNLISFRCYCNKKMMSDCSQNDDSSESINSHSTTSHLPPVDVGELLVIAAIKAAYKRRVTRLQHELYMTHSQPSQDGGENHKFLTGTENIEQEFSEASQSNSSDHDDDEEWIKTGKNSYDVDEDYNPQKPTSYVKKIFKCDVCDKVFKYKSSLTEHKRVHTKEKPFKCKVCQKAFTQSGTLIRHARTHTGERRYKCTFCNKAFTTNHMLIDHVHSHTGQKPYKCTTCGKGYASAGAAKDHMAVHLGERKYICNICSKAFIYRGNLRRHLHLHTGIKNFKCEVCEKPFADMCYLRSHMSVHTGEKNHQCSTCGRSFAHASSLSGHQCAHRDDNQDLSD